VAPAVLTGRQLGFSSAEPCQGSCDTLDAHRARSAAAAPSLEAGAERRSFAHLEPPAIALLDPPAIALLDPPAIALLDPPAIALAPVCRSPGAQEGITIADCSQPDMPLIYANAGFARTTGYSADYVIGRNCR
jgi:hypothetical protein